MRDNLFKTFLLTLVVVAALIGMFFMPKLSFGNTELRRVNILADVEKRDKDCRIIEYINKDSLKADNAATADSVLNKVKRQQKYVDDVPSGMVAIEDRIDSVSSGREMDKFYRALSCASERNVRIAYFGDSSILCRLRQAFARPRYRGLPDGGRTMPTTQKGWVSMPAVKALTDAISFRRERLPSS